jgi:RND superfamily putative drug exporter
MTVTRQPDTTRDADAPAPRPVKRLRWLLPAAIILLWLVVGGPLASLTAKIAEVQQNDNAAFLPASAESTEVLELNKRFVSTEASPAIVVYGRDTGLTEADRSTIVADMGAAATYFGPKLVAPPLGPIFSEDGKAAQVILQFAGSDVEKLAPEVVWLRTEIGDTPGLAAHVTGPVGIFADFMDVFGAIDSVLLLVTGGVVLLILFVVYRSPLLPLLVLGVAGFALGLANGVVYLLAKNDLVTLSGQSQGILDVLVLGAATDYALLLVSRFREELRRHRRRYDAIRVALRASLEPILASGGTVILGLLCLLASDLGSNRGLGPVGAIGIACALLAMLTLMPAALALLGRAAFWPFRPAFGSPPAEERGVWSKVAAFVGRRPRLVWAVTALVLLGFAAGITRLEADGIPQTDSFTSQTDSRSGQELVSAHFPAGTGSPAQIVARADKLAEVTAAARSVPGVAEVTAYTGQQGPPVPGAPVPEPKVVDGLVRLDATLVAAADSKAAGATIGELRAAVRAVDGADAKVGGFSAINLDVQKTSQRDRNVIIPIVLVVVFVILALLLRSLIAALMLVVTVVLSFFATLGVSGVVFRDLLGFAGADSSFPLYAFVFLVALGVDYNIFLMTRVREEVASRGHKAGTLAGLSVTGGVITSAGVVLAATFAALAVLPLVVLFQMAFAVAFGVLLDTLIVRSLLVPALTVEAGRLVWWPGKLRRGAP